jgi:hypothetical protein
MPPNTQIGISLRPHSYLRRLPSGYHQRINVIYGPWRALDFEFLPCVSPALTLCQDRLKTPAFGGLTSGRIGPDGDRLQISDTLCLSPVRPKGKSE